MFKTSVLLVGAAAALWAQSPVDFKRDVGAVIEANCLGCHNGDKAAGNLRLDNAASASKAIVAGVPDKSPLLVTMDLPPGRPKAMPPGGPQVSKEQRDKVRAWIAAGAVWPAGVTLGKAAGAKPDEKTAVSQLHERIVRASKERTAADMKAYKTTIPTTVVSFEMVPVPGGSFDMGNAANANESPVHKATVEPFWMQKTEVTWDEYRLFMFSQQAGEKQGEDPVVDAVSRPTRPYVEMSFGMGINGYPAISMTQHAANKYAQWLSARTGHFYRLPTEAEWEYACRAGGGVQSPSPLGDYAWFGDNANGQYGLVGKKKPNAFGLYDMLGNVMEWTLDEYMPDYKNWKPWSRPTKPYPHAARGGSWNDPAEQVTCTVRVGSDASWKMQDPQLPKSIWYLTDAQWLGFRLVRPLKVPPAEQMYLYWNNGVERE